MREGIRANDGECESERVEGQKSRRADERLFGGRYSIIIKLILPLPTNSSRRQLDEE